MAINRGEFEYPKMGFNRPDLIFPMKEYKQRIDKVREKMKNLGVDAYMATNPENIFYLCGYQTLGYWYFQALVIPADDSPFMVLRHLEYANVEGRTYLAYNFTYQDHEDPMKELKDAFVQFSLHNKKIGVELHSYFLRNTEFSTLKENLPDAEFFNVSGLTEDLRLVKSNLELESLKKAGRFTNLGMQSALSAAKIGQSENLIAAAFYQGALGAGSHYMAVPPFVASGPRSFLAHATFNNRTVEPNEFILVEGAAAYERYHAPTMRTIYMGKPEPWFRDIEMLLQEALTSAIRAMKPGVKAGEIDAINQSVISRNDFGGRQNSRTGYSVGIAFAPDWGEGHILSLVKGDETELKKNMVFHVLSYIEIDASEYSQASRFGLTDSVYVTEQGGRSLIDLPYNIQFTEY